MKKVREERNDGWPVVGKERNDNSGYNGGKHAFPEPTLFCMLLSECLGCVIGSFLGTVLVKILTQLL